MDELKSKFLDLIHLPGSAKIPVVSDCPIEFSQFDKPEDEVVNDHDEPSDADDSEVLKTIDRQYFGLESEFDSRRYELTKFKDMRDLPNIENELEKLKKQQSVVSKNVLEMIRQFEKESGQEEFKRLVEVQSNVEEILQNVRSCRSQLGIATRHFTTASLGILANYRKRTIAQTLLRYLKTFKTLYEAETRSSVLLKAGDFPGVIDLLLECQGVAALYRQFTCVAGLSSKLQDTLFMTEEHLDVALGQICYKFNNDVYKKLQTAYSLLGKTQIAMDQLHMHYTSAVHNSAYNVVHSFSTEPSMTSGKLQYSQICKEVPEESLIPCLLVLSKSLWYIVLSYYQVVQWHQANSQLTVGDANFESNYNEQYVREKLNNGLNRLWTDVQTRVSGLVLSASLSDYKIDEFLEVLAVLHRMSQIGEELCGSDSKELANSVRTQSSSYFSKFHSAKLDDLKVFLENESWTLCPVRHDFSLLHLQEFRGLRYSLEQSAGVPSTHHNSSMDSSSVGANFFSRFSDPDGPTPFDSNFHVDSSDEDILTDMPDECGGYYSEESEEETEISSEKKCHRNNRKGPLLTNTTLTVLRLCGKYLQMSRLLKSISVEVVSALTQIFEYYLYTVHEFFACDTPNPLCPDVTSLKLQSVLKRLKETLFQQSGSHFSEHMYEPVMSSIVDLKNPDALFGLSERIIAVESLIFLSSQFTFIKSYLEQLLTSQGSSVHQLQLFYNQTVSVCADLRRPVYASVSWSVIDYKHTLSMMSRVDWEVKDLMSAHSKYVDFLIEELQNFKSRFNRIEETLFVPEPAAAVIWDNVILLLSRIFVEGFASPKRCSSGGRALMQLDFTQLVSKLEKLCPLRPIPYKDFVDAYVKAYYQREEELESWIKDHGEYSTKQLMALVSSACPSNKKLRQKLTTFIEELEKSGIR